MTDKTVSACPKCGKIFEESKSNIACAVLHAPGECCHYGHKEVTPTNPPTEIVSDCCGAKAEYNRKYVNMLPGWHCTKCGKKCDTNPQKPTVDKWERDFDEKFGDPDAIPAKNAYGDDVYYKYHIEYMPDSLIKNFIRTLLAHSVQEAKAEMASRAVDECLKYYENPTYELRNMILSSLKQKEKK